MSDPFNLSKIFMWVAAGFLALLTWLGKRHIARVDGIEKNYVSREEHNDTIKAMRTDMMSGFDRIHDRLDKLIGGE